MFGYVNFYVKYYILSQYILQQNWMNVCNEVLKDVNNIFGKTQLYVFYVLVKVSSTFDQRVSFSSSDLLLLGHKIPRQIYHHNQML